MKKIITLLAVATGLAIFTPSASQAYDGHGHGSSCRSYAYSCRSCGSPVYRERVVVGRDRHGCLQYGYRTISHRCAPSWGHGHGHSHGHSRHSSSRGGFFFGFGR